MLSKEDENVQFIQTMNEYTSRLYGNLEASQRAMKNWRKLKILIVLLRVCGNRVQNNQQDVEYHIEPETISKNCRERLAPYVVRPNSYVMVIRDVTLGFAHLFCYLIDPFTLANDFKDLMEYPNLNRL